MSNPKPTPDLGDRSVLSAKIYGFVAGLVIF